MHGFVDFLPLFLLKGIFLYIERLFWHTLKLQRGCNVCLPLTPSQQDRDRRPLRRFFHQNLFFWPITSKVSPSRI